MEFGDGCAINFNVNLGDIRRLDQVAPADLQAESNLLNDRKFLELCVFACKIADPEIAEIGIVKDNGLRPRACIV